MDSMYQMNHITVGVRLITKWCFPRGKHLDWYLQTFQTGYGQSAETIKGLHDESWFWDDDALVASEIVEKFWAEVPGIYVRIDRLP